MNRRAVVGGHLLLIVAGLALGVWAAVRIVAQSPNWLWIAIWFAGAAVVHDLVAFPLYAAADRALVAASGRARVSMVNQIRVPALGSLLLLVVFLPQIGGQGDGSFTGTSGLAPGPYLLRWVIVTGVLFALSAVVYGIRVLRRQPRFDTESQRVAKAEQENAGGPGAGVVG